MRAVVIDDSAEDRRCLRAMLGVCPGVDVVGEATDIDGAMRLLASLACDVVFLDIHLGRENGLDLMASLEARPAIVVTSAHPHHGEKAFDLDAVDYLVKPFSEDRLLRAIGRARKTAGAGATAHDGFAVHRGGSPRQWIVVDAMGAILADDKYSRVLAGSRSLPDHRSLREWEALLEPRGFVRIDRSTLLRPGHVLSITPYGRGARLALHLATQGVEVGRVGRERLEALLASAPARDGLGEDPRVPGEDG